MMGMMNLSPQCNSASPVSRTRLYQSRYWNLLGQILTQLFTSQLERLRSRGKL